jgi:hypothetical protein
MTDEMKTPEAADEKPKAKMGRPTTLAPEWQALADKLGGVKALCERLGCAERTLRHWASGDREPSKPIQKVIEDLCYENGIRVERPIFLHAYQRKERGSKVKTAKERAVVIASARERRVEVVAAFNSPEGQKAFREKYPSMAALSLPDLDTPK